MTRDTELDSAGLASNQTRNIDWVKFFVPYRHRTDYRDAHVMDLARLIAASPEAQDGRGYVM